jgi:hypothetical protein
MLSIVDITQTMPDRQLQQATLIVQYQHILAQLDRRLRSALDNGNQILCTQLEEEQRVIQARLS